MKKVMSAHELRKLRDAGEDFVLVNTLPRDAFAETKLPGAVNIPQEDADFAEKVEQEAGSKDRTVVVYCANMMCDSSTQGAEKLVAAGFTDVYDFEAGAQGWKQAFNEKEGGRKAKEDAPLKR
jgi:rhodanese-related sulfurtransferase